MNQIATAINTTPIREQIAALFKAEPNTRARNAAQQLGISELELLVHREDLQTTALTDDWQAILTAVTAIGEVMALTRNAYCVHERKGVYENLTFNRHGKMYMGLAVNPDIDLRLFLHLWSFGYGVIEKTRQGLRHSLQFFDKHGEAVHKIYLTENSRLDDYLSLLKTFVAEQNQLPHIVDSGTSSPKKSGVKVNAAELEKDWRQLQDVHDFFPMLKKHRVERLQALQLVPKDLANQITSDAIQKALQQAALRECEIMIFVGSKGCIQIHTGKVNCLKQVGPWFNVLDSQFNLHLNITQIDQCWVTRKPGDHGIVTAIEAYDNQGELIVQMFGKRKPGQAELQLWRTIVESCECELSEC